MHVLNARVIYRCIDAVDPGLIYVNLHNMSEQLV